MRAGILNPEDSFGVECVVFGGEDSGSIFEIQAVPDDGEIYCIVLYGGLTYYGGIEAFERTGNRFSFTFTEDLSKTLKVERGIQLDVSPLPDDPPVSVVESTIRRILENEGGRRPHVVYTP